MKSAEQYYYCEVMTSRESQEVSRKFRHKTFQLSYNLYFKHCFNKKVLHCKILFLSVCFALIGKLLYHRSCDYQLFIASVSIVYILTWTIIVIISSSFFIYDLFYCQEDARGNFDKFWTKTNGNAMILVKHRSSDRIIGCSGFINKGIEKSSQLKVCELKRMWVVEEHRGTGAAYLLMNKLMECARCQGYEKIVLTSGKYWQSTINFYKKHGFTIVKSYNYFEGLHIPSYWTNELELTLNKI